MDHLNLKNMLHSTIVGMCRNSINCGMQLRVKGLISVTIDNHEFCWVDIDETVDLKACSNVVGGQRSRDMASNQQPRQLSPLRTPQKSSLLLAPQMIQQYSPRKNEPNRHRLQHASVQSLAPRAQIMSPTALRGQMPSPRKPMVLQPEMKGEHMDESVRPTLLGSVAELEEVVHEPQSKGHQFYSQKPCTVTATSGLVDTTDNDAVAYEDGAVNTGGVIVHPSNCEYGTEEKLQAPNTDSGLLLQMDQEQNEKYENQECDAEVKPKKKAKVENGKRTQMPKLLKEDNDNSLWSGFVTKKGGGKAGAGSVPKAKQIRKSKLQK